MDQTSTEKKVDFSIPSLKSGQKLEKFPNALEVWQRTLLAQNKEERNFVLQIGESFYDCELVSADWSLVDWTICAFRARRTYPLSTDPIHFTVILPDTSKVDLNDLNSAWPCIFFRPWF